MCGHRAAVSRQWKGLLKGVVDRVFLAEEVGSMASRKANMTGGMGEAGKVGRAKHEGGGSSRPSGGVWASVMGTALINPHRHGA